MIKTVALLAGGLATRLRPVTEKIPKSLIDINGKPFIYHQLNLLKNNGIKKVVICAGYLSEMIEEYVKDGKEFGVEVVYSKDGEKLLGTGGALKRALPLLGEKFFVMYGDSYLTVDYQKIAEDFEKSNYSALMTIIKNENKWDTSNVIYENGKIIKYDKNSSEKMDYVDYGLEIMTPECLNSIPNNIAVDLSDIFKDLIVKGKMGGYEVHERFYEIGSFQGIEDLKNYLKI